MIEILDEGYVKLIPRGTWGDDELIIESARMSTGGGFVSWDPYEGHPKGDMGLLRYLWKHRHTSPFEMCGATFEVYAPIIVIREWHRHRTQSYNEMSGRYVELPNDTYVPSIDRLKASKQSKSNKQASEEGFTTDDAIDMQLSMASAHDFCRGVYEALLSRGVAKEVARTVLPVAQYSRFRASTDLWNWLRFLDLRLAANAQWEIRQYANALHTILAQQFPRTLALFDESRAVAG